MKHTLATLVLVTSLTFASCAAPVTIVTPAGHVAYTADQIVVRVNELENAAIAAEAKGSLATPTAYVLVRFSVDADAVLAATPSGWQTTVYKLWQVAKSKLTFAELQNPAIAAAVALIDAVLASFSGV